MLEKCLPAI